jgi:NADH dehydrogenase
MPQPELHVVTGAFGFSGRYIAARLLREGHRVRTLTDSPHRVNPFGGEVEICGFHFDRPGKLAEALRGADVLYNTYWVRFDYGEFGQAQAVENTLRLFAAARNAGVKRVVHLSITNPSADSPFAYFRHKALLERALVESGMACAILRPAVLFGPEDILINNIAWVARRFPVFGVFGKGDYCLQPIHVDDLAELAVAQGQSKEDVLIDAIGPETFAYCELVRQICRAIGKKRPIVSIPPSLGWLVGWGLGKLLGDVLLTREEIGALMDGLLCTDSPPAGRTKLTEWARAHADTLGLRYASELARRR